MSVSLKQQIESVSQRLLELMDGKIPTCALILGSGLNFYADRLEDVRTLPFAEVEHLGYSTAEGHVGRFVFGKVPGCDATMLCMQGRLHGYEGWTPAQVALPVWAMAESGIDVLITTNAAGAINPGFKVGSFCLMVDQMNLTGRNPLCGIEPDLLAPRFVPMLDAFDPELRKLALEAAAEAEVDLNQGVYAGLLGPSFETPAEIRALGVLGADTVAMSVVEEVIAARHLGMRVMGMSLVSNMACGVAGGAPTSDEVNGVGRDSQGSFAVLMDAIARKLVI